MPPESTRRKKPAQRFNILVVPGGEGGKTRTLNVTKASLWLLVVVLFFGIAALGIALVVYTPLGYYLPVRNPQLERKYGSQIMETQQKLNTLAEEFLVLKDYNIQLRRALGEGADSIVLKEPHASVMLTESNFVIPESASMTNGDTLGSEDMAMSGDYDLAMGSYYNAVVTNSEGFRAAFPLIAPTEGFQTQGFDPSRNHFGLDYAVKLRTPVYAATDGYVVFAGWTYDDGNMLIIAHGGGYMTVYKHNQSLLKSELAFVRRGELIAQSGDTGKRSGGPHLHFEVWKDGTPSDPKEFLLTTPTI